MHFLEERSNHKPTAMETSDRNVYGRNAPRICFQGRRFPAASIEQAFSIRRFRVSSCLAESIQLMKSLRAIGVRSCHFVFAIGAAVRALRRSVGTLASDASGLRFILFMSCDARARR